MKRFLGRKKKKVRAPAQASSRISSLPTVSVLGGAQPVFRKQTNATTRSSGTEWCARHLAPERDPLSPNCMRKLLAFIIPLSPPETALMIILRATPTIKYQSSIHFIKTSVEPRMCGAEKSILLPIPFLRCVFS